MTTPPLRPATSLYLGAFVLLGTAAMLLGPSLETFRVGAGVSTARIGVLFSLASGGYLVGSIGTGRVLHHLPLHRVLAAGFLTAGAALFGLSSARGLVAVCALQVLLGLGTACIDVAGNTAVLWAHRGGPVLNALHLGFGVGATVAPVLVNRSLAATSDIRAGYLVLAVAAVSAALWALRTPSPPNPHAGGTRGIRAGSGRLLAIGVAFFVAYVGVELGFAGWIFEYAVDQGLARNGAATWLGTAFLAAFTAGRVASIPIARFVGPYRVLLVDASVCAVGLVLLLVGGSAPFALWAGTIVFGFGTASMFPTMLSLAEPHIPATSTVTSAFLVGSSLGSITVPVAIGALLDGVGPLAMPAVVLAGVVVCAVLVYAFETIATREAAKLVS